MNDKLQTGYDRFREQQRGLRIKHGIYSAVIFLAAAAAAAVYLLFWGKS